MTANFATVLGVENVSRPLDQTLITAAPTSASSELPVAIEIAVLIEPLVVALAIIAARNIAGQARYPHSTIAEGKTGRGPNGRGTWMNQGEGETDLGEDEIGQPDSDQASNIVQSSADCPRGNRMSIRYR